MPPAITFPVHDVAPGTQSFAADEAALRAAITSAGAGWILVKSWDEKAPLFGASELPALAAAVDFVDWREDFWRQAIDSFAKKIGERTEEVGRLLVCDFSTTGPVEQTVSQVVLMDAMASFFEYIVRPICGIPSITLEGTREDWRRLRNKVERLGHYGIENWTNHLLPICEQFVRASAGDVDRGFWQRIFQTHHSCGGEYLTGWIGKLFPYLKDDAGVVCVENSMLPTALEKAKMLAMRREWLDEETDEERLDSELSVNLKDLPGGLSTVPVVVEYPGGATLHVRLCAGLVGLAQDDATHSIRPVAGWALCSESRGARLRERLEAESVEFHPPLPREALARRLRDFCWDGWDAVRRLVQSELAALYSITDGASLHVRDGVAAHRILPLAEVSEFEMPSPGTRPPRGFASAIYPTGLSWPYSGTTAGREKSRMPMPPCSPDHGGAPSSRHPCSNASSECSTSAPRRGGSPRSRPDT